MLYLVSNDNDNLLMWYNIIPLTSITEKETLFDLYYQNYYYDNTNIRNTGVYLYVI